MVDGASNVKDSGIGVYCRSTDGEVIEQFFRLRLKASNNEAEYEALIAGLRLAITLGARWLKIHSDLQLVGNQVFGKYTAKDTKMKAYLNVISSLVKHFKKYTIQQVSRDLNTQTDALASFGSSSEPSIRRSIPIGFIEEPSIKVEATMASDEVGKTGERPL